MDLIFSKRNMEILLDYMEEGVQIIDSRGRIIYYNRAASELEDIKQEDTIGRHILEVYPSLSPETSTLLHAIRTGMPRFQVQQTFINYKGKKITTINTSLPLKANNKIVGAIEVSKNITDVREMSERLVDLQERLLHKKSGLKQKRVKDSAEYTLIDIIGQSQEMLALKGLVMKASQTPSPILIYGETGTGKELFVQAIHNASPRRDKPFIAQNCAALPSTLLESILFGTVKGSFTGADDRAGLFELAHGGTLFLDEINAMPMELQAKLLRVLQDGNIRRVGDIKTRNVDVRIIAASNMEPRAAVEGKQLRQDLYYRLNAVELRIPDLKERKEDIPLLIQYFIDKFNDRLGKNIRGITPEVQLILQQYAWPGNVRELEHIIEGAMNLMDGEIIQMENLPVYFRKNHKSNGKHEKEEKSVSLKRALEDYEQEMIRSCFEACGRNVSRAAEALDIPRQTLQYKLKKYGLTK